VTAPVDAAGGVDCVPEVFCATPGIPMALPIFPASATLSVSFFKFSCIFFEALSKTALSSCFICISKEEAFAFSFEND
jgi:hypothetical protein